MCESDNANPLLTMRVSQFTSSNPGYHHELIKHLGFRDDDEFAIVKCVPCGFVYSPHQLVEELAGYLYEKAINHEQSKSKVFTTSKRRRLIKLWMGLFTLATRGRDVFSLRVLDFGCGWGDFLMVAQSPGVNCLGFELDKDKAAWAKSHGISVTGDLCGLSSAGPFDVIMANSVLEHVPFPRETVKNLTSMLVPNGVAFFSVPDCNESELRRAVESLKNGELPAKEFNPWEHLNYFSPASFRQLVLQSGLDVINDQDAPRRRLHIGPILQYLRKTWRRDEWLVTSRGTSLFLRNRTWSN